MGLDLGRMQQTVGIDSRVPRPLPELHPLALIAFIWLRETWRATNCSDETDQKTSRYDR